MEAVRFSFNDYDFIIEAFQAAGVNRVLAAVEDSVTMRPEVNDIASQSPGHPEIGGRKARALQEESSGRGGRGVSDNDRESRLEPLLSSGPGANTFPGCG